ncbi:MAG TPA: DUF4173 domain-containing protein [Glycomyces sp.]|nr:DUF4173 domain-containing protein [Glycomyces sp.]
MQAHVTPPQAMVPAPPPPPHGGPPHGSTAAQAYYDAYHQRTHMLSPNPRWYRPEAVPKPAIVLLVLAVALFGGWAAFHGSGVGIGLALTGIAMVAVPLAAGDRADLVPRLPGAVLVAALWSVAAIRDAGWVVFLCSAAAFLLTPLVLAPQRRFSGNLITLCFGWTEGIAESFKWAKRGRPGKDGRSGSTVRNLWVAVITAVLLLVFGALFATADSTFAKLIARLLPEVNPFEFFIRLVLAAFLFPLVLVWVYTAVAKPRFDSQRTGEHRTVSRFELAVPLGALNLLFAAFIAVQLRVYLGGKDYVMETTGLTFADYARRGFWQLCFVAVLSLAVIGIAAWLAPKREKADRWTVRILLGTLGLLSMVVIASALFRMYTYFETYGLTRMRVWVFTVEIWLAVLFALVIVCCWKLRATWLPRAVLASGGLALLGLAAVNPDALIARYNLDHEHEVDQHYLQGLSDDAVPEFAALSDADLDCLLSDPWSPKTVDDERDLMSWNLGFQRAQDFLDERDSEAANAECTYPGDWEDSDGAGVYEGSSGSDAEDGEDYWSASESTPAEATEGASFFDPSTCEAIDTAVADRMFGEGVDGSYGVEPDRGSSEAWVADTAAGSAGATTVEARLTCAYYGIGSAYMTVKLEQWATDEKAEQELNFRVVGYETSGFAIEVHGSAPEARYVAVDANADFPMFGYLYTRGNTQLEVLIAQGPVDDQAVNTAAELTGQLEDLYDEIA